MTHSTAPAHPKKAAYTRAALCLLLSVLTFCYAGPLHQDATTVLAAKRILPVYSVERDDRVMVEHVEARVQGSDDSHVRFKVEAIALDDKDVASLATAMQQRIEEACDTMLGTPGTTARVRFLPSKTTVQTVEVSGE